MPQDIQQLASQYEIDAAHLVPYGTDKAKVKLEALDAARGRREAGRLILVSAITPTPAGEGKTTVSIGLAQGLRRAGLRAALALRQPSMGPVFGRKGGATGGGLSSVLPADSLNLHFTGDFHAVTSAHNLLAAAIDNDLHFGRSALEPEQVTWKRVMDVNDRALRRVRVGVGGRAERETGFDITAASEIMAILCLATSPEDLRERLERMVIGFTSGGEPVRAGAARVTGAMAALLRDALLPNLAQSVEGVLAFVHGGPFANIAHGCNSVLATRMALAHADYAVTEAGFAFDLGGEKFMHIKCRQSGLAPAAVVIVATVRALKMHGGVPLDELGKVDLAALRRGLANLDAHLDAAALFERPVVVAVNRFGQDAEEELAAVVDHCRGRGVRAAVADVFSRGGAGAEDLVSEVLGCLDGDGGAAGALPALYPLEAPVREKIHTIATRIYGANGVTLSEEAEWRLAVMEAGGLTAVPVCMAKTQNSLSDDPSKPGRPTGFTITVRDFEPASGAGFLVALTGDIMRMPALPRVPAAERIDVSGEGVITGPSFS